MAAMEYALKRFAILTLLLMAIASCDDDDGNDEKAERSNISGTVTFKDGTVSMTGGLLDERSDSLFARRTFEFKISSRPIGPTVRESFEMYVASDEKISLHFKLTSDTGGDVIKPGTYSFSPSTINEPQFPEGLVLSRANLYAGTGSSTHNHPITGGTVTVSGDFPDYTLTFSLTTGDGSITGSVSGEFITRASWHDFFAGM